MESQNGWGIINSNQLDRSPIPGTNVVPVPGVQAGDVATVLLHVGKLFNERVQKVYNPGCWGWNPPTKIPGSNIYSNHSSGTAIDLNAPSFPWKSYTMTKAQREACQGIVRDLEHVVAWGGDFPTIVDEMHFEIDATEEEVKRIANKIRGEDMYKGKSAEQWAKESETNQSIAKIRGVWLDKVANAVGHNPDHEIEAADVDRIIQLVDQKNKQASGQSNDELRAVLKAFKKVLGDV